MFSLKTKRRITVAALVPMIVVGAATPALAVIGLPYAYTITYISGGSHGVTSDKFYTNASGDICVSAHFKVKKMTDGGAWPDRRYTVKLYRVDTFGDELKKTVTWYAAQSTTSYSTDETCWYDLAAHSDYKLRWQKVTFDTGTLDGYGRIGVTAGDVW